MTSKADRLAMTVGGALLAWVVLSRPRRGGGSPGAPGVSPGTPGSGYTGGLYALEPEPLAPVHDTWELSPEAARAVRSGASIPYVGGGPWDRARCVSVQTAHARDLAALIRATFPWNRRIGGIRCESHHTWRGDEMSIHAVGRALDVMTPVPPLVYGSSQGEQLANWAVRNAQPLGIQLVIWNRASWQGSLAPGERFAPYTRGTNVTTEHRDHVHIEVTS